MPLTFTPWASTNIWSMTTRNENEQVVAWTFSMTAFVLCALEGPTTIALNSSKTNKQGSTIYSTVHARIFWTLTRIVSNWRREYSTYSCSSRVWKIPIPTRLTPDSWRDPFFCNSKVLTTESRFFLRSNTCYYFLLCLPPHNVQTRR